MFRNGEVTKRSINATKVTYFQKFSNLQMLLCSYMCLCSSITLHRLYPAALRILCPNTQQMFWNDQIERRDRNIHNCIDIEEGSVGGSVLAILIMLWPLVSDKFNKKKSDHGGTCRVHKDGPVCQLILTDKPTLPKRGWFLLIIQSARNL